MNYTQKLFILEFLLFHNTVYFEELIRTRFNYYCVLDITLLECNMNVHMNE